VTVLLDFMHELLLSLWQWGKHPFILPLKSCLYDVYCLYTYLFSSQLKWC